MISGAQDPTGPLPPKNHDTGAHMPKGRSYGHTKGNYAVSYGPKECIKAGPFTLFLDLESPHTDFKVMRDIEVHLGIVGDFSSHIGTDELPASGPRIDLYIGGDRIQDLIDTLIKMKRDIEELAS